MSATAFNSSFFGSFGGFTPDQDPSSLSATIPSGDTFGAQRIGRAGDFSSGSFSGLSGGGDGILPRNAAAFQVARVFDPLINMFPVTSTRNFPLRPLTYAPYFQNVYDLGKNPDFLTVLVGTQMFQNELETVGPSAIPGYPIIENPHNFDALSIMGSSEAAMGALVPGTIYGSNGTTYKNANGLGQYFPPPPIQRPYPYSPRLYPHFSPFKGEPGSTPATVPYPGNQHGALTADGLRPAIRGGGFINPEPASVYNKPRTFITAISGLGDTLGSSGNFPLSNLVSLIQNNPLLLPSSIPFSGRTKDVVNFINKFNKAPESFRVNLRLSLSNPTTANETLLGKTGVETSGGGRYNQGTVSNPFSDDNLLTDTNPFARFGAGLLVTDGNGNGKVKGTVVSDILLGTRDRNNIIDGRGGQDNIVGSTKRDLAMAHPGDWLFLDSDDDFIFFDMSQQVYNATRTTKIDGGTGKDWMVITVDGDPTKPENIPSFKKMTNGAISITLKGVELQTNGVERFFVADRDGNLGGIYDQI